MMQSANLLNICQLDSVLSDGSPSPVQAELDLIEICWRSAERLSGDWPSQQVERDFYDGKKLPLLRCQGILNA